MKKCVKRILVIFMIQTLLIMLIPIRARAEIAVDKEADDNGVKLTVRSNSKVVKVRMYVKDDKGDWSKFYENSEGGYTVKPFYFKKEELNTKDKDNILVRVDTVDGSEDVEIGDGNNDGDNDDGNGNGNGGSERGNDNNNDEEPDEPEDELNDDEEDDDEVEVPTEEEGIAVNEQIILDMPSKTSKVLTVKLPEGVEEDNLKWETSNKTIAKVDTDGKVTAVGPGICRITVSRGEKEASCLVVVKFRGKKIENGNKVYFLDTQKGTSEGSNTGSTKHNDAMLLECKGKYALIDTSAPGMSDRVVSYLKDLNITELEWVLITCFDNEHCGGLEKITHTVGIKEVYMKKIPKITWHEYVKHTITDNTNKSEGKTKIRYITESENKSVNLEDIKVDFYNRATTPMTIQGEIARLGGNAKLSEAALNLPNMYSIVAVANLNGRKVAFMGDQSSESVTYTLEETMALQMLCDETAQKIGDVDVYKAANHGINGNRLSELNAYNPEYVVVTHELVAHSDTAKENPSENFKKFAKYTKRPDGTNSQNIYYTGKGTRILSVNVESNIYFQKLKNDDSSDQDGNDIKFKNGTVDIYVYSKSQRHSANLANLIEKGKTKDMTWSISDESVASIDDTGKVTAIKTGVAIVTVKNNKNQTGTCNINVIGLVGDSTDYADMENNTLYLQEMVDTAYLNAGKGENAKQQILLLPKGTYNFVATGTSAYAIYCRDNVAIEGAGKYETILKPYGNYTKQKSGTLMFRNIMSPESEPNEYYGNYLYNADFKNFTIDGSDTSYVGEYNGFGRGISLGLIKKCDFNSILIKNTDGIGFFMMGPVDCTMNDCEAQYCGKAIENNVSGSGFYIGEGYSGDENMKITNSYSAFNSGYGFGFSHYSSNYHEEEQLYNSYDVTSYMVEHCRACGNLYDFGGIRPTDVTFSDCKSEMPAGIPEDKSNNRGAFHCDNLAVRCKVLNCKVEGKFEDVKQDSYAYDAINWGLDAGITEGVAKWKFAPENKVDRGMAIAMIWRAEGRPGQIVQNKSYNELKTIKNGKEVDLESGFSDEDLTKDKYYYMAVKWGKDKGIVDGVGNNLYRPKNECTRAQFVVMLWNLAGSPKGRPRSKFTDVPEGKWYEEAVNWAADEKITVGTSATTFKPERTITRAEAMTMLYQYYNR